MSRITPKEVEVKFGVLTFSYAGFKHFEGALQREGYYTVNIGDYMQTLAMRDTWSRLGISVDSIVSVDRDTIKGYRGETTVLPVNACFYEHCFPFPENIIPVFYGFQTRESVIAKNVGYLKRYEPIGCRDLSTAELMRRYGIDAFVSGCVTLTFSSRDAVVREGEGSIFMIYGEGAGLFPGQVMPFVPHRFLDRIRFISHRKPVHEYPLGPSQMALTEAYAREIFRLYREQAEWVITPLHHVATPCWASDVPAVLVRTNRDARFGFLESLWRVYYPGEFAQIDWLAGGPDLRDFKCEWDHGFLQQLQRALRLHGHHSGGEDGGVWSLSQV